MLCVIPAQNAVGSSTYARGLRTFGRSFKAFLQVHVCVFVSKHVRKCTHVRLFRPRGVCARARISCEGMCCLLDAGMDMVCARVLLFL